MSFENKFERPENLKSQLQSKGRWTFVTKAWQGWMGDILKDVISNIIAAIILLWLGSTDPFKRQIRNLIKYVNDREYVIKGQVRDEDGLEVKDAKVFCLGLEYSAIKSDDKGNFSMNITISDETKYIIIIATKDNSNGKDTLYINDENRINNKLQPVNITLGP